MSGRPEHFSRHVFYCPNCKEPHTWDGVGNKPLFCANCLSLVQVAAAVMGVPDPDAAGPLSAPISPVDAGVHLAKITREDLVDAGLDPRGGQVDPDYLAPRRKIERNEVA